MPTPQGPQRPPAPSPEAITNPKASNTGDKNSAGVQKRIPAASIASRPQQTSLSSRTVSPSPTAYHDYLTTTKNTLEQQKLLAQSLNTLNDLSQGKPCEEDDFVLTYTDNQGVEHQIFPPAKLMQQYMKETSEDVGSKLQKSIAPFVATDFDKKADEIDHQIQLLDAELINTEARLQNIGKSFTPYKSTNAFIIENVPLEAPKVQSFSNYQPAAPSVSNPPGSPKNKPKAGNFLFKQPSPVIPHQAKPITHTAPPPIEKPPVETPSPSGDDRTKIDEALTPALQTHDLESEWPEPPSSIITHIPYQQGNDSLRTVLPPEHRPQNRKVFNFTGENPEKAIKTDLKSVTNEEIEELEYRVILNPDSIQTKLKQERAIAKLQGQQGSQKDEDFLAQNQFQAHFENVVPSKGVIDIDNGDKLRKKTTQIHYETATIPPGSGIAAAQGRRDSMEDAHMARQFSITIQDQEIPINITAVFDGHAGDEWAQYAQKHIVNHLQRRLHQFNESSLNDTGIWNALKIAFVDLDREMLDDYPDDGSGTTANVVLNIGGDLWVANLGDSRSILVDANGNTEQISEDAKPNDERYHATITKRGGMVRPIWGDTFRVNGKLAVARSLGDNSRNMAIPVDGDPEKASGAISARPKVTKIPANELKGKVLIQTCDGIPDVASSHEIGNAVIQDLKAGNTSTVAAAKLVARAFEAGSRDNLSAIVTMLDPQFPLGNMHKQSASDFQQVSDLETRESLQFDETTNTKISIASFVPSQYDSPVKDRDTKPLSTLEKEKAAQNKVQKLLNKELAVDDINLDDDVERNVIKEHLMLISELGTLLSNKSTDDDHLRKATTALSENIKKVFPLNTQEYFSHKQQREFIENRQADLKASILEQTIKIEQQSRQCEAIFSLLLNKDPSEKTIRLLTNELKMPGKAQHIERGLNYMFGRAAKNNALQTEKPTPDPKRLPEPVTAPSLQADVIDAPENITSPLIPDVQTNWKGCVIPFRLDYNGRSATEVDRQARCILDEALSRLEGTNMTGIGITYSANHEQTTTILNTYKNGNWQTGISGANQADVMATMESLQASDAKYHPLRGRLRIVPVSTCQRAGGAGEVTDQEFKKCTDNVEDLLKDGWQILGWQNQDSVGSSRHPFAIGGGVSKVMPQSHKDTIQDLLMRAT